MTEQDETAESLADETKRLREELSQVYLRHAHRYVIIKQQRVAIKELVAALRMICQHPLWPDGCGAASDIASKALVDGRYEPAEVCKAS